MKKIWSLLLVLVLVVGIIGGCGKSEDKNKGASAGVADSVVSENKDDKKDKETEKKGGPTKEGEVLYEDENVKLVFKSFNFQVDGDKPYLFAEMEAENKTEYVFDSECLHSTMNSYMSYASSYDTLEANTKTEINLLYDVDSFENTGISKLEDVKELVFTFNYWSANDDSDVNIDDYKIKLYPNADRDYEIVGYEVQENDIVMIDEDGFKFVCIGQKIDGRIIYLNYYAVNETDEQIVMKIDEPHAGDTLTRILPDYITVYAHKESFGDFSFWAKDETVVNAASDVSFVIQMLNDNFQPEKEFKIESIALEK